MNILRGPITWFGGKGKTKRKILPFFPNHRQYCEPYFGGGSLFFAKKPCEIETINDIDEGVFNFFKVLRDNGDAFIERAELTEHGEALWCNCRDTWQEEQDELIKAWKWWVVASQSFGGLFGGGHGHNRTRSNYGMAGCVSGMHGRIARLPEIIERLRKTQIFNCNGIRAIERCDTPDCLHYVDPPYVHSTRKAGKYAHEMDDAQHEELLDCLLNVKGYVVLSGYANKMYERLGWERHDYNTVACSPGRTQGTGILGDGSATINQERVESIWLSPNIVEQSADRQTKLF